MCKRNCKRTTRHRTVLHVARADSSGRQHGHASSRSLRCGSGTSEWCLRGQNHQAPSPQVCPMAWRRLRSLLLRRSPRPSRHSRNHMNVA